MTEKKITAVAVRLKPEDKATSIFLKERKLVADRPGHVSDNKLIHKFIEAYPRIADLEQQIGDLQTQLQAERDRCEKFEEESREMDSNTAFDSTCMVSSRSCDWFFYLSLNIITL